jgi:hypothetical protein
MSKAKFQISIEGDFVMTGLNAFQIAFHGAIVTSSFLTITASFATNRITGPIDLNIRCLDTITGIACNDERSYGLKSGCINQEEFDSLVKYNAYPVCDRRDLLKGWCSCGCFQVNTKIYSINTNEKGESLGYQAISKILNDKHNYKVISLSSDATLSSITTKPLKILSTTSGPEKTPLIVFTTANEQRLAVTTKHAILLADGRMVAAKDVKITDLLVQANGVPVAIKSIESEKVNDNVLNILTDGNTNIEHTLFAEGLIVGDLSWQNNLKNMLNAVAIRK